MFWLRLLFFIAVFLMGMILGSILVGHNVMNIIDKKNSAIARIDQDKLFFSQWIEMKQYGEKIEDQIIGRGYKTIAIYGVGLIGKRLIDELYESTIKVEYAIDINPNKSDIVEIIMPDRVADMKKVDAIIVSNISEFDNVSNKLKSITDIPICNILDLRAPVFYAMT